MLFLNPLNQMVMIGLVLHLIKLNLPLDAVLPSMVDVPYDKADQLINKVGGNRRDLRYKLYTFALLLYMFLQIPLTLLSVLSFRIGLKPIYRSEVLKHVGNCDLVISHSDENFKETASRMPLNPIWVVTWWSMLLSRTCEVIVAKSLGKPVIMFPNSVGPFRTWFGRFMAMLSLNNCDTIMIRESISFDIVKQLKLRCRKILTYDTALLYVPKDGDKDKPVIDSVGSSAALLGVCPGIYSHSLSKRETENYIEAHVKALDHAIEKDGFSVVFLPHYISGFPNDDLDVSRAIFDKMKNKHQARIVVTSGVKEFKQYLDQMDLIISSEMHPAILGATGFVPILCIVYDQKQSSFFERLNMSDCTIGIRNVSFELLSSKIGFVWKHRNQIKDGLGEKIPKWQKNVRESILNTVSEYIR